MASPTANSNEAPHATVPGQPSADDAVNAFVPTVQAPGAKPDKAFTGAYGPLSEYGNYTPVNPTLAPVTKSVSDMIKEYYTWSDKQKQDLRNNLALISKSALTASDSDIAGIWGDYVQQSANYVDANTPLTPWDILKKDIATRSGPEASKAGTKTQTTSDTSLTSRIDSDAVFKSAAQSLLGRAPTTAESAAFQKLLNSQESQNPTTATVTSTTDAEGNVTNTNRTSQGGLGAGGAALLAQRQAQQDPEYGAYQAATTYMNALLSVVGR